jgi:hypothetical protein
MMLTCVLLWAQISPFTASSATFPRTPTSPFPLRRRTVPAPRTSLFGRLALPRLPRRILIVVIVVSFTLYLSAAFTTDSSLSAPLTKLVKSASPLPKVETGDEDWLVTREDGTVVVKKSGGKKQGHPIR